MKSKKITQFISCAVIFSIMSGFTVGCGESKNSERKPQTAEQVVKNSYSAEKIEVSEDIKSFQSIYYSDVDDVYYCLAYVGNNYDDQIYSISSDLSEFKKIDVETDSSTNNYISTINALPDGGVGVFIKEISYGDLPPIDFNDESIDWETFDYTPYEEAYEEKDIYAIFDKDGNKINSTDLDLNLDSDVYISAYYGMSDGSGIIATDNNQELYIFDKDGKQNGSINLEDLKLINSISTDSENNIICNGYGEKGYVFNKIDFDGKTVSEKYEYDGNLVSSSTLIKGYGDYSFFITTDSGLMGYSKNTNSFEEIVNWLDSDISPSNLNIVVVDKNMSIIISEENYTNPGGELSFSRLVKRDASELENQQIINIGMIYLDTSITSMISEFNKENNGYRIRVTDYSSYDTEENDYTDAAQQLNNDIISGNAPDIIFSNGSINLDSLASSGVFADLYEFIDKDEELNRDSFLPLLKANEYNGKLFSIGHSFYIDTLIGKTEYVGEKENWTIDELISAYENRPKEDMKFMMQSYKQNMFYYCFSSNINSYIDYENKTFNFDKDKMVDILNFVNTFEEEPDWDDENTINLLNDEWADYNTAMINDKYLVLASGLYDFRSYHRLLAGNFGGQPVTFVGFPSSNGSGLKATWNSGTFSIMSNSGCKDGAWDFIRQFLLEEYQSPDDEGNNNIWGFPINQNAYNKLAEMSKSPEFWIDPDTGEKLEFETTFWTGDKEIPIGDCTDEEITRLTEMINNLKSFSNYSENEIYKIIDEETDAFFKGDKSAEETADIMINRISIYIAEKN